MKISGKERFAMSVGLAVIGSIAAIIWVAYNEVNLANRQRQQISEIARELSAHRLVTFEYLLYHNESKRTEWYRVAERVGQLIANARISIPAQELLLADMSGRATKARALFMALTTTGPESRSDASPDGSTPLFEAQLLSELLSYQQADFTDTFHLNSLSTERIIDAQRRVMIVILSGLALIAAIMAGTSWFLRHDVLAPIAALLQATRQVAAGNWDYVLAIRGNDEIGELSENFAAMTKSLQHSFAHVERSNQEFAVLNEELQAFSYSVSHDLRGPLRSMDGFSQVLIEDYGAMLDEEGKDALRRIRAASQRMGALIDDLLKLSKVTRADLNVTRVDLSAVAHEIADSLDREQPGRPVEWVIEPGLTLCADPALIRIAMQNLLQNAWKFTGRAARAVIRVGALERDAQTVYFVADNGVGFDMAYADKLFGAFQRLHHVDDFPGTGIGLAIVQRIIRRHDGKIWAEAKEGEGAAFFFYVKESENGSGEQDHPAG